MWVNIHETKVGQRSLSRLHIEKWKPEPQGLSAPPKTPPFTIHIKKYATDSSLEEPYFVPDAEAGRFRDHATPHLIVNLHHPPQNFPPETRNQFPGTDLIMDVREGVCCPSSLLFCVVYELMGVCEGRFEAR